MRAVPRFKIKKSTIPNSGNGVFTRKPLAQGRRILVTGVLIKRKSDSDRCTRYADAYKFRVRNYVLIPTGWGGMINHSAKPNLEKVIEGAKVLLRAMRPIAAGEELFLAYGRFAQSKFYKNRRR